MKCFFFDLTGGLFTLRLTNWDGVKNSVALELPLLCSSHLLHRQHVPPAGSFQTVIGDFFTATKLSVINIALTLNFHYMN